MRENVLLVGELISNGGLGLLGDAVTVTSLGCNPLLCVSALSTIHNPLNRIFRVMDKEYVIKQIEDCREKPGFKCVKIGALNSEETVDAVSRYFSANDVDAKLIYCPIVVSDMGAPLLDVAGIMKVQKKLLPLVDVLVLNIYDAEILTGISIPGVDEIKAAAEQLRDFGAKSVLITGGLLDGHELYDVFLDDTGLKIMKFNKHEAHLENPFRFGGAWILASAVAAGLAKDMPMIDAINQARQYVDAAIALSSSSDGKYQSMCLTHTISKFEYNPDQAAYNVVQAGAA